MCDGTDHTAPPTDVSSEQAFRDFDLKVPPSAKVMGYYASAADDT